VKECRPTTAESTANPQGRCSDDPANLVAVVVLSSLRCSILDRRAEYAYQVASKSRTCAVCHRWLTEANRGVPRRVRTDRRLASSAPSSFVGDDFRSDALSSLRRALIVMPTGARRIRRWRLRRVGLRRFEEYLRPPTTTKITQMPSCCCCWILKLYPGDMAHPGRLLVVMTAMLVIGPGHIVGGVQDLIGELRNHIG